MSSQTSSMTSREESEFASRVLNPSLTAHGTKGTDSGKSAELLYNDDEVFQHPPRRRDQTDTLQRLADTMYELLSTTSHDPISRSEILARIWLNYRLIPSALQCQVRPDIQSHPFKISALSNVYAGFLEDGTPVALKGYRLSEDNLQSKVRQFFLEAEIWKSLSHPSILEFYGIYSSKGNLYLVSPLMKGSTLPEFLAANPKSDQEKLVILGQIANGLAYLHSRPTPVLHGDCRGVNVLVNEKGQPVIADFGCSMIIHPSSPNPRPEYHIHAGSPRWTAPEKLRKSQYPLGLESDIYALACLAIELFSERIPFHHLRNDAQVIIEVLVKRRHPSWPEDLPCSDSFRSLLPLLVRCWSHDPTQRPSISDIQKILASHSS